MLAAAALEKIVVYRDYISRVFGKLSYSYLVFMLLLLLENCVILMVVVVVVLLPNEIIIMLC